MFNKKHPGIFACAVLATVVGGVCLLSTSGTARADELPIIDAHSQFDQNVDTAEIIRLMDKADIVLTILSARGRVSPDDVAAFAGEHPDRIVAALRTKGGVYSKNKRKYYKLLKKQAGMPVFKAMAEIIMWHAQKGNKAEAVIVPPDDKRVAKALDVALAKGWPFIPHIEYAAAGGDGETFLSKLEKMFAAHPEHPFLFIHMGQLPFEQVERLIGAHGNVYFLVSHSNSVTIPKTSQPWTNLFDGDDLAPRWKDLMVRHPDRFVLNFDNVFAEHWGDFYLDQVVLWRKALAELPHEAAHMIAHKNAERLWRLNLVQ